ncbi:hypothetical protein Tco_0595401 [Tanacetum coccineum]
MPLDSSKPPDPILQEFSTLTGMSSEDVKIKVQSPGSASAGAGAILKKLRNSKMVGKGRSRSDSSPSDVISGKRANSNPCPIDDVLVKVLDKIAYDRNVSDQMVFKEGVIDYGMGSSKISVNEGYCLINGNDGSFINKPSDPVVDDVNGDYKSIENKGDCVTDSVDPYLVSNGASKLNIADGEHVGVESTRKVSKDRGSGVKGDSGFVFGNVQSNKGILKKPTIGLTSVQFGPSMFYMSSSVWSSYNSGIKAMKSDGSLNIESFAEKMKKGVEDRELQMNFTPHCVSKKSDGSRRKAISEEDIKKGSEACALQLYGYFVGTLMDYRVVNSNLSRMWRVYGVAEITKTRMKVKRRLSGGVALEASGMGLDRSVYEKQFSVSDGQLVGKVFLGAAGSGGGRGGGDVAENGEGERALYMCAYI